MKKLKNYILFNYSKFVIVSPFLILFMFGCFFPIGWSIAKIHSFSQFGNIFLDPGLYLSLKISIFISMISTFVVYSFSYILASELFFSKSFFYKKILLFSIFSIIVLPSYSLVIIYRSIIEGIGGQSLFYKFFAINTDISSNSIVAITSVIFVSSLSLIPFTTFLIYSSFKNVKSDIIEMGKIDGLESGGTLWHILLPITFPVVSLYVIFNFLKYLKNFQIPFLMTSGYPPLKQGIFPHSIVGATTNLGIFLFNKLNNVYDLSIIASYSLAASLIILLFAVLWYFKSFKKIKRIFITFLVVFALHFVEKNFLPLFFYSLSVFYFYRHSKSFKTYYFLGAILDLVIYIVASVHQGVYNNFLVSTFISIFLMLYVGLPELNFHIYNLWPYTKRVISVMWVVIVVLPIFALIQLSFSYVDLPPFTTFFSFSGFKNFALLFTSEGFLFNILNTFIIAFFASLINIIFTFPMVVAVRSMPKIRVFVYGISIFFGIFTGVHTIIPIYKFFANFYIFNTYVPIVLMSAIHSMPMTFLILFGFLNKYGKSYDEVAIIEGSSLWYMILKIYFPLSFSAIFLSFIYTFVQSWNSFMLPLFLINDDRMYPVSIKLYNYVGSITSTYPKWNLFASGTLLNLVVLIVLFYFMQKHSSGRFYENFY